MEHWNLDHVALRPDLRRDRCNHQKAGEDGARRCLFANVAANDVANDVANYVANYVANCASGRGRDRRRFSLRSPLPCIRRSDAAGWRSTALARYWRTFGKIRPRAD